MTGERRAGESLATDIGRDTAERDAALAHLKLSDAEAERHSRAIARHQKNLSDRLGRDVGHEVAILDYFLNISPRLAQPTIIERAALAEIERNAMTDALTGLFNRRFLEAALGREVARCRRYGVRSSLVMLDVDDFKATNDRFGHGAGDAALRAVGELICRHLRAVDIPCRYGGDEFAVVLPDTYGRGAQLVAERMCEDVRRHSTDRPIAGCWLALTVSAGVASYDVTCVTGEALLTASDRSLYEAKAAGGDRVAPLGS